MCMLLKGGLCPPPATTAARSSLGRGSVGGRLGLPFLTLHGTPGALRAAARACGSDGLPLWLPDHVRRSSLLCLSRRSPVVLTRFILAAARCSSVATSCW